MGRIEMLHLFCQHKTNCEGTNPCSGRGSYLRFAYPIIPLDDGTFCVLAFLGDYGDHQSVITRKATYRDIVRWVKETYNVHVKNIDISRAKQRCGLAHMELDRAAPPLPGVTLCLALMKRDEAKPLLYLRRNLCYHDRI